MPRPERKVLRETQRKERASAKAGWQEPVGRSGGLCTVGEWGGGGR